MPVYVFGEHIMPEDALLRRTELPRPDVTAEDAAAILEGWYGLTGPIVELGSQQDRNYRVDTESGRFVLKICRADYATVELRAQNAAMRHIAGKPAAPRVPCIMPGLSGEDIIFLDVGSDSYQIRLLDYLDGEPLTRRKYLSVETVAGLGRTAAQLALALADFEHPGLERELQWDLRRAGPVGLHLLKSMTDKVLQRRLAEALAGSVRRIQALAPELRLQAIHHDVTDDNVVAQMDGKGHIIPDGVIDFGDILKGWLVADLAVTCASLLHHADGDPFYLLPAIRAFHAVYPLNEAELAALWPLIVARATILVASSEQQLAIDPDNEYVIGNIEHERTIFDVAVSVPFALMEEAIRQALHATAAPAPLLFGPLLPDIDPQGVQIVDFGTTGAALSEENWSSPDIEHQLLAAAAKETGFAATRYGEYRLTRTRTLSAQAPATLALNVTLRLPAGTIVAAPFDGQMVRTGETLVLAGTDLSLHLSGLDPETDSFPAAFSTGDRLGLVAAAGNAGGLLSVQLCRVPGLVPPAFSRPAQAAAWSALCPSPSSMLGFDCDAPALQSMDLLARRETHFARPQKNYYDSPPQIERGWKEHLYDVEGRAYLDMLNNVTILGHGHPRLSAAVARQWSLLNTNSRFHYASVAEFSERLADLAPQGLDTVFLVNSGSEANDLALRLAWAASGAKHMLCLLEAYHGWSVASDAVSTSIADNPQALTTRPPWVHPVISPNTYRGKFRGPGSTGDYVSAVLPTLERIDATGEGLAGFICECVYGNAGGIPLPPGYLQALYAMVRERGGLCIADEVQVGYGRLGHYFWGFEEQGVVPDIITVAKGMGNGHPLGAVITTRAIADALEKEGYFFSSSGGSPVSSVVGMTVLDVLRDEGLQENARIVGDHLKARLEALCQRFPLAGAVHGMGLYLGLEFVRDRTTLSPATQETAAICNRLRELGVIMQPTGDHLNVLKIKPPLCLSIESADFFADMLERVLSEGW